MFYTSIVKRSFQWIGYVFDLLFDRCLVDDSFSTVYVSFIVSSKLTESLRFRLTSALDFREGSGV